MAQYKNIHFGGGNDYSTISGIVFQKDDRGCLKEQTFRIRCIGFIYDILCREG